MAIHPENPTEQAPPRVSPPEPPRFVPTLTDVVHLPVVQVAPSLSEPIARAPEPAAVDIDALAARVCDSVLQGLDAQLRQAVADMLQAEHKLLMQDLRTGLLPLVENQVREALAAELGFGAKFGEKLLSGN
jgi:hypothetical protein